MNEFWVMDNLKGPNGWLTAQAISVVEDEISQNPIQLRWMINPCILGMPTGPFTVAVKRVPKPSDLRKKTEIANEEGWKKIEIVGLPLDGLEGCSQYDPNPQGPVPEPGGENDFPSLLPNKAAVRRLELGAPIRGWESLPGALPNTMSDIEWRTPSPQDYVDDLLRSPLMDGICQLLDRGLPPVEACKFEVELAEEQAPHLTMDVTGEDPDFAMMSDRHKSGKWSPLGIMLLAAATDPLASLALGFGTAVPFKLRDMAFRISGEFNLPDLGTIQVADVVWVEDSSLRPDPVKNLRARLASFNPPERVDGVNTESIAIQWDRSLIPTHTTALSAPFPVSYAVAKFGKGGENPRILLTLRSQIDGWLPYVASKTGDNRAIVFNDHIKRETFPNTPDPFGRQTSYLVAAQDIFGRWSDWETTTYQSISEATQIPVVLGVMIKLRNQRNEELQDSETRAKHDELTVDFSWDWTERSPQFIELSGAYADDENNEVFNSTLKFAGNDSPNPTPDHVFPLDQEQKRLEQWGVPQDLHPDPLHPGKKILEQNIRYYRLTMELDVDFANKEDRFFQVKARGQCTVHERAQAGFNISPFGTPVSTLLKNPNPPDIPKISISEPLEAPLWATLPDAAGESRILLHWAPVPRAKGYFLYEATESSLLAPTDTSLPHTSRLARLRELPLRSKRAEFQRVNREPIQEKNGEVTYEVKLPRGSRVIHIYAVTAKTENQIESGFPVSSQNYFAVATPRLGVPSPPILEVTAMPDTMPPYVELRLHGGPGIKPSRFEIYRTHHEELTKRLDKMGPPVPINDASGEEMTLIDKLAPGWERVWYRAVVWSADDPLQGIVGARSLPSPAVSALLPPAVAPTISDVRINEPGSTETEALVSWKSDMPLPLSPLGYHEAAVQGESAAGAILIHQRLDQIKTFTSALGLPPMPPAGEIILLREGNSLRFLARVPRVASEAFLNLTLKMIDPLGHIGTRSVRVPQLNMLNLPQLSPIAFSWLKEIPYVRALEQGLKAEWEILSPIHEAALSEYKLTVRLESTNEIPEPFLLTTLAIPVEHTFTLEQIFAPTPAFIQHSPNTGQFSIPVDLRVFQIAVTLTDPLGKSVSQTAEITVKYVPNVADFQLADAVQKITEEGFRFSFPEGEIVNPEDLVIGGTLSIVGVDLDTKLVDFLEPAIDTPVPTGGQLVIHTKPVPRRQVPQVVGLAFQSAEAKIRGADLIPQEAGFTDPDFEAGKVAQVMPDEGTTVAMGSIITYVVGSRLDFL